MSDNPIYSKRNAVDDREQSLNMIMDNAQSFYNQYKNVIDTDRNGAITPNEITNFQRGLRNRYHNESADLLKTIAENRPLGQINDIDMKILDKVTPDSPMGKMILSHHSTRFKNESLLGENGIELTDELEKSLEDSGVNLNVDQAIMKNGEVTFTNIKLNKPNQVRDGELVEISLDKNQNPVERDPGKVDNSENFDKNYNPKAGDDPGSKADGIDNREQKEGASDIKALSPKGGIDDGSAMLKGFALTEETNSEAQEIDFGQGIETGTSTMAFDDRNDYSSFVESSFKESSNLARTDFDNNKSIEMPENNNQQVA